MANDSALHSPARSRSSPASSSSTSPCRHSTPTPRPTVRIELHELLRDLALPTILVTHDFEDAAALADHIGVIVDGRILQSGTAAELVASPADPFVASFTGATLLEGTAPGGADGLTEVVLDAGGTAWSTDPGTGRVGLAVYPWEVSLSRDLPTDSAVNHIRATVASIVPLGNRTRVRVGPIVAEVTAASAERLGTPRRRRRRRILQGDGDPHPLDVTCEPRTLHADLTTLVSGRSSTGRLRRSGRHVRP